MALTPEYLSRLQAAVEQGLLEEQGAVGTVHLEPGLESQSIVMQAAGRRLALGVEEPVYHFHPDGSDAAHHASWLVQLFDEEAR